MSFVSNFEQKRTWDPERGLEYLPDYNATSAGSSGYWAKKIVGENETIHFYVRSRLNFRSDDATQNRFDKTLTWCVL